MRQRLLQHASRSLFIAPAASASHFLTLRLAANPTLRSSAFSPICIHTQQLRPLRRYFADERKPSPSSGNTEPPKSEPIHLGALPGQDSPESSFEEIIEKKKAEAQAREADNRADVEDVKANIESHEAQPGKASSPVMDNTAEPQHNGNGELPSTSSDRRAQLTKRFSHLMDNLQSSLFVASRHINDLTGYSSIDGMKRKITEHEEELAIAKEEVRTSRLNYKQLVADRAASQREVTTLLARKDSWTPIDLERFTQLYRSDHGNEHAVQEAAQHLADVERQAEQAASKLNSSILARYHEEQIWSDKIRRMSTWGTWGLMGVNVLLFLVFQFGFEPWRRDRLTRGFEDKVRMALAHEREIAQAEQGKFTAENAQVDEMAQKIAPAPIAAAAAVEEGEEANAQKEDPVADVAPELIAAIEEYAEGQVPETDPLAGRHEAEAESVTQEDMSAALDGATLDAETEILVSSDLPEDPLAEPLPAPTPFLWSAPETWTPAIGQSLKASYISCAKYARCASSHFKLLFSDRKVELRMQDVTVIALEGVATGAAIATMVVMYIIRPN